METNPKKQRSCIPAVTKTIKEHFRKNCIHQTDASKMLGVTPQAVSLQLKQPFGKCVSKRWEKAFGFNPHFLMTGTGELIAGTPEPEKTKDTEPINPGTANPEENLRFYKDLCEKQNQTIQTQQETINLLLAKIKELNSQ